MKTSHEISSAILAGGKSSRMGRDKALLEIGGKPFIRHIAGALSQVFEQVVVVSDHGDRYAFLGLQTYEDVFKECGPLGGIHSALKNSSTKKLFFAPCDIPFLDRRVIQYLLDARGEEDVTIFSSGDVLQPLCGIYDSRILPTVERHLRRGRCSVLNVLGDVRTACVATPSDNGMSRALVNINTVAEYSHHLSCFPPPTELISTVVKLP